MNIPTKAVEANSPAQSAEKKPSENNKSSDTKESKAENTATKPEVTNRTPTVVK